MWGKGAVRGDDSENEWNLLTKERLESIIIQNNKMGMVKVTVSLCMIAYNEEKNLSRLLSQVLGQNYPKQNTELIFVDSASTDGTRALFEEFAALHQSEYLSVRTLDNPKKSQAAGWNVAIENAVGDVIIRLDAHAEIPDDFILSNMKLIESGENVCGGARPNKLDASTPMKETLLLAESSMFGSSIASYRRESHEKQYVSSVFHGAYRREVFAKVGGFHEDLGRTEDNELHFRIRQAGYKICQGSDIISYQYIRGTISSMMQQKFGNGKWIGLTLGVCYQCLQTYHFVPFFFVITLLCSLLLFVSAFITGHMWMAFPFCVVFGAYLLADLMMSLAAFFSAKQKNPTMLLLPCIFFLLHCAYGFGTIAGVLQLPFFLHRLKKQEKENGFSAAQRIENVRQKVIEHTVTPTKEDEI